MLFAYKSIASSEASENLLVQYVTNSSIVELRIYIKNGNN